MKKFKQTISGLIALLMILTTFAVMPAVSAAEVATLILDEDCSDAPAKPVPKNSTEDFGDWEIIGAGNTDYADLAQLVKSADATGMTLQHCRLDETNSQRYAVRKLTQDPDAANLTEGVYEITFDVTPTEDSWLSVTLTDSNNPNIFNYATNQSPNNTETKIEVNSVFNLINKNSVFFKNNKDTGWRTVYTTDTQPEGIGYIIQPMAGTGIWQGASAEVVGSALTGNTITNNYWKIGDIDELKPISARVVVNLERDIMATYIYQESKLVASNQSVALADDIKTNGLGYIAFGNANGETKVSNLKVKKLEGYEGRFFGVTEGFDNDQLFLDNSTQVPATYKGWNSLSTAEGALVSIDKTKDPSSNVLKIDVPQMEGTRLYLKSVNGGALTGEYKVNYRMFVESGEAFAEIGLDTKSADLIQIRLDKDDTKVRNYIHTRDWNNNNNSPLFQNKGVENGTFDPTKWCDVEMIIDVPGGKWSYTVKQDSATIVSADNLDLTDSIKANGFNFLQFRELNSTDEPLYYIDDIKVEEYEYVYVEPEFENINATFDDWTTVPPNVNWDSASTSYEIGRLATIEGTNKAILLAPNTATEKNEVGLRYKFPIVIKDGTLNVSYDFKAKKGTLWDGTGGDVQILWPTLDPAADGSLYGVGYPELNNLNARINYNLTEDKGDAVIEPGAIKSDTWYTVNISVRPALSKYDISITEKENGASFCDYKDKLLEDQKGNVQNQVAAFSFRTWQGENYIDNLKIEHIKQKPVLTNSSIKMYDRLGKQTPSITSKVTPVLEKIELDFGTAMDNVDGITLVGDTVGEVTIVPVIDETEKNKVTIPINNILASEETYTLTVPGTVLAVNNETMGSSFGLEFTTSALETIADMTGLSVGETPITTFAELSAKDESTCVINTSAINASDSLMELTYVVAYYKGNMCLSVKNIDVPDVAGGAALEESPSFRIEIPAGATRAKIFLWSTLNKMIPYCGALELK